MPARYDPRVQKKRQVPPGGATSLRNIKKKKKQELVSELKKRGKKATGSDLEGVDRAPYPRWGARRTSGGKETRQTPTQMSMREETERKNRPVWEECRVFLAGVLGQKRGDCGKQAPSEGGKAGTPISRWAPATVKGGRVPQIRSAVGKRRQFTMGKAGVTGRKSTPMRVCRQKRKGPPIGGKKTGKSRRGGKEGTRNREPVPVDG